LNVVFTHIVRYAVWIPYNSYIISHVSLHEEVQLTSAYFKEVEYQLVTTHW